MKRVFSVRRIAGAALASCLLAGAARPLTPSRLPADQPVNINVLVEGQSNAALFLGDGGGLLLKGQIERLLGFRGRQTVTVLGGQDMTMWSGIGLVHAAMGGPSWLTILHDGAWHDDPLQRTFVSYLQRLPAAVRSSPTVTVWLHNETDSANPALQQSDWESAIRHNVEEERLALGQAAASTPVDFVYVPADCPNRCLEVSGASRKVQMLKAGYEDLVADPAFNAHIGAQIGDSDMDGLAGPVGGLHLDPADVTLLAARLSATIANQVRRFAQPGSPETMGELPSVGPEAISARRLDSRHVLVGVRQERGDSVLTALSSQAAQGAGWAFVTERAALQGVAAERLGGDIVVTFDADLPASSGRLYYGWGSGRIANPPRGDRQPTGRNAAIYDTHGLPLWICAAGVVVSR